MASDSSTGSVVERHRQTGRVTLCLAEKRGKCEKKNMKKLHKKREGGENFEDLIGI